MYKVYYNGTLIHDPSLMSPDYILLNGKCSVEAGKVDTMDFTILPNHPFYNTFTKLQTGIVAYRDNVEIFRGRILSSTVNMNGEKSVQCEGSLAYLLDSVQPIMKVDGTVSCANLFRTIIANHNNQVEAAKQFQVGIISATKASDQIEVNQTSYTETRSMIDSYLLNTKGGYLRARFENGVQYIDWIEDFGRNPNQPFVIGANIVEMSEENSTDDFYTILLPLGKEEAGDYTTEEEIEEDEARDHTVFVSDVNGGSPYMPVSNEFVQAYGRIYHMEDYGTVSGPAELKSLANDTLDQFRKKLNRTVEITGLDLHFLDPNYDQILIGDRVNIIAPNFNKNETLMATKIDYDFSKPQGDRYSFGDGVLSLTRKTETGISTTKKTAEKAKDNSLTNGRDLLIKKNLIDIEANKLNLKVNDAMNVTAKYVKWTFDAMAFTGNEYKYGPEDQQRIRGELADRWASITRTMEGYISPEQGLADFKAISKIVTNVGEQTNRIYMSLDSDQGFFNWGVESKNLTDLTSTVNDVKLVLNGPDGTGGLVSQVYAMDQASRERGELLREAGIYVNPDTGAWLFNTDHTTGLGSVIKAQDDKASMVVTTKPDGTYAVNVGEIALAFNNQTGQSISRINADKIMISTGSQYNPLDSYLALQDGKINLVVHTDSQGNWVVNPASIIAAINNRGQSEIKINADNINLNGYVTAEMLDLEGSLGAYSIYVSDVSTESIFVDSTLNAPSFISSIEGMQINGELTIASNAYMGSTPTAANSLWNAIKLIQLVPNGNNTYTLQKQSYNDNDWQDVGTFSRATTLSRSWSGGEITVTATPQGNTLRCAIFDVVSSDITWNSNVASFPLYANLDGNETKYPTGKTLSIDATSVYNAGVGDVKLYVDRTNHTISASTSGLLKSGTISADGIVGEYDYKEGGYPVTVRAKFNDVVMDTGTVWVVADMPGDGYQEGYDAGYAAGLAAARIKLNTSRGTISIGTGGDRTEVGVTVHLTQGSWDYTNDWRPITISAKVDGVTMASYSTHILGPNG